AVFQQLVLELPIGCDVLGVTGEAGVGAYINPRYLGKSVSDRGPPPGSKSSQDDLGSLAGEDDSASADVMHDGVPFALDKHTVDIRSRRYCADIKTMMPSSVKEIDGRL